MRFFKSITTIFIALSILTSVSVLPVYSESASEGVNLTKEVHTLTALGIISDAEEDYSRTVKRTEFADAIAKMMTETFANYTPIFDLTAKDKGMQWLYSMNKIEGSGGNVFSPQSTIIVSEAVKMALSVLGYDELAKVQGGYPEGYRSVGYLHKVIDERNTTDEYLIRVLDQGGTWETFPVAERVSVDGESVKKSNINISSKTDGLVKYFVNIHGEVTEMFFPVGIPSDPASTPMNEEFQEIYKSDKAAYRYYNGGNAFGDEYNSIVQCPNSAIFFVRPKTMNSLNSDGNTFNRECISVVPKSFIKIDKTYDLTAYSTTGTPGIISTCILAIDETNGAIVYEQDRPMVVNDIRMALNEDDEVCYQVIGLLDGADKVFNIEDERTDTTAPLPFGIGDVIQCYINQEGKYVIYDDQGGFPYGWKMLCDYTKDGGIRAYINSTDFKDSYPRPKVSDGNYRVKYGTVYDVEGTNIFINVSENPNDWKSVEAIDNKFGRVYVWDEAGQKFRNGSNLDAVCAKYDSSNATKAYVLNYNQYLIIVMYPAESVNNAGN